VLDSLYYGIGYGTFGSGAKWRVDLPFPTNRLATRVDAEVIDDELEIMLGCDHSNTAEQSSNTAEHD
jgi:hypothetical protein